MYTDQRKTPNTQEVQSYEIWKFIMHCDFFEVHKNGEIEKIEFETSGKMLAACKKYFDDTVIDFYVIKSKSSNELGLLIRL